MLEGRAGLARDEGRRQLIPATGQFTGAGGEGRRVTGEALGGQLVDEGEGLLGEGRDVRRRLLGGHGAAGELSPRDTSTHAVGGEQSVRGATARRLSLSQPVGAVEGGTGGRAVALDLGGDEPREGLFDGALDVAA